MLQSLGRRRKVEFEFQARLAGAKMKATMGSFGNKMSATTFMRRHGIVPRRPVKIQ
ncbi:hypothetical protein LCGC14_2357760 [marine sediment metagenome]|uniref:Uncharacterized protein n=1 Tax=marine sediment metagenome TaxID=412755 RepID=A0A0F9EJZ0_9ZZZZ